MNRAGRAAVAALGAMLVAKSLPACVNLDSLGNGPRRTLPDVIEAPDVMAPLDPCEHTNPPSAPTSDESPADELPPFVLAIDQVVLDPARARGFDLDGVCTCDGRPGVALDGGPSCASATLRCDLEGGVDNAMGAVAKEASPLRAIDTVTNELVAAGARSLLIQIEKYNGRANDSLVEIGVMIAEGITAQGCPASTFVDASQTWTPGRCGNDRWSVASESAVPVRGEPAPIRRGTGYVRDFQLVVRVRDGVRLPFNQDSTLTLNAPILMGTLVPLGEDLNPRDPSRAPTALERRLFRLESGLLAGRVATADVLAAVGSYRQSGGQRLCASDAFTVVRERICGAADIARDGTNNATAACDALSSAFGLVAVPALAGAVVDTTAFTGCEDASAPLVCP